MYSVQLKAWIDLQVDARLNQVLQGSLDSEIHAARQDCAAALQSSDITQRELNTVMNAQAQLLNVVEGLSEEMARLKACQLDAQLSTALHGGANASARGEVLATVEKVMSTVDDLKRSVSRGESECTAERVGRAEAGLDELRRLFEQHKVAVFEFTRLHDEHSSELSEAANVVTSTRREVDDLTRLLHQLDQRFSSLEEKMRSESARDQRALTVQSDLEGRLEALRLDVRGMSTQASLEVCLEQSKIEITKQVMECESRLGEDLGALQRRVMAELRSESAASLRDEAATRGDLNARFEEIRREILDVATKQVSDSEVRLGDALGSLQQRLVSELRAETTAAFRSEAAAVAALDEQIWLTDQRLGQRIDELLHLRIRDVEREVVSERRHAQGHGSPAVQVMTKYVDHPSIGRDATVRTVHVRPGVDRFVESMRDAHDGVTTETVVEYFDGSVGSCSPQSSVAGESYSGGRTTERQIQIGGRRTDASVDGGRHRIRGDTLLEIAQRERSGMEEHGRSGHHEAEENVFDGMSKSWDARRHEVSREREVHQRRNISAGTLTMAGVAADALMGDHS
uniref:Uncharacterized protein n=1 Tax=Noctiluca scintillans TaxID=2966 RepID=A0A7S0ZMK5_NOCSC